MPGESDLILEMRDISKEFPGVKALDGVSLSVRRGEIHAICGENGAGKSTLMKVLSGVHPHGTYSGEIFYNGALATFANIRNSEHAGIVIIHQELALIPELSIMENIFLGNEVRGRFGVDWTATRQRAKELMARVGLQDEPDTVIKTIGVGKQQLVEIAKAISKDVKLLILDEPTAALNENDSAHLLELIREFKCHGMTCIMISHKLNEIAAIADSITIIRDGKSVETINVPEGERVDEDRLIRGMVGRALTSRYPDHTPTIGEVMFEVKDWTVRHPEITDRLVCKGSSFNIRRGEIVGFAGLMGAGRTELARSLFGKSYGVYQKGQIFLDGKEIAPKNVEQAIELGIAYVTEDRKVLGLNLLDDIRTTVVSAELHQISPSGVVDRNAEFAAAEKYRKELRIKTPTVNEGVVKLSGGNQQKVVVAKWLFTEPEVLILDEPTRGIDVGAKYEMYGIMNALADQGKAIMMISSELPELLGTCDRIYTVSQGAITGCLECGRCHPGEPDAAHDPDPEHHQERGLRARGKNDGSSEESVRWQPAPVRHAVRPCRAGDLLPPDDRWPGDHADQPDEPAQRQQLHPGAGHRHGDGDRRRPHRPVGRLGRGVRRHRRRDRDARLGHPVVGGHPARPGPRRGVWRHPGRLRGLRRHPRLHRDAGRLHVLPRREPVRRQVADRPGTQGLPVPRATATCPSGARTRA